MNTVPTQFCASLSLLRKDEDTAIAFQVGSLIYDARNRLAMAAVQMEADIVLWLDSDMVFNSDTLDRLLETYKQHEGDIVSGLYCKRVPPYTPVLYEVFDIDEGGARYMIQGDIPKETFEVQGCGFGCVLTPVKVLKDVMETYGPPFYPLGGHGEDLSFCWRARQLGYKIFCDPSVSLGHVGYQVITRSFYDRIVNFGGNNGSNNT